MRVTWQHMRTIPSRRGRGYCRNGARALAKRHGLDFRDFVRNGIEAEALESTGDAFALALVAWARECETKEHGHG